MFGSNLPLFPEQASTLAPRVDALLYFLLAVAAFFSLLISISIVVFAIKYRRRSENERPPLILGNLGLEVLWTVVPLGITMVIFVWGAKLFFVSFYPPANALEINSSSPTLGVVKGDALHDIVLIETAGDMNVDRIRSDQDDVSLTTRDGGILDAFNDAAADSIGVNLFFQAAGRIGATDNDFDIDSSTPRPGRLVATSSSSMFLTETDGLLNVQRAISPGGAVRLTTTDTVATDEDIILMEGGLIFTNELGITLRSADDVDTQLGSLIFTSQDVVIEGDFNDADLGIGSRIVLRGATLGDAVIVRTGRDALFSSLEETNECLKARARATPRPPAYKDYCAHPFFSLPEPRIESLAQESRFLDVLYRRRSIRAFSSERVTRQELSLLLKHVWGQTDSKPNALGDDFLRKTSPSGGSLHGAEVYPILINVEGVPQGLYHYSVRRHGLELISQEDAALWVSAACGDQPWVAEAAALFVTTYKVERLAWKYTFSRGFRAALLDVGHLGQTFGLVATHLGLGPFTTIALRDEFLEEKLGLDWRSEPVILMNGIGHIDRTVANPERPRP